MCSYLLEHTLGRFVVWMPTQQLEKHGARPFRRILQFVHTSKVEVRLIERRRNSDTFFETGHSLIASLSPQIEHTQIIERLRITGTKLQSPLQIIVGAIDIIELRINH